VGLSGCGSSSAGGAAPEVLPDDQRNSPVVVSVPRLNGAGDLVVGRPGARPTVVNLWASWCGPCKSLIPNLEIIAEEFRDSVILAKVCLDDEFKFNREIGVQFGVMSIPNVVILYQGNVIGSKLVGLKKPEEYRAVLKKILNS
jgi:putative thioredoxin